MLDKYPGLSPYNYCFNNPINAVDPDGDSVVVLLDSEAAGGYGHMGELIGNEKDGWKYFSKNGKQGSVPNSGASDQPNVGVYYPTLESFGKEMKQYNYTQGFLIESNKDADKVMKSAAEDAVTSPHATYGNNCADAVSKTLQSGGLDGGNLKRNSLTIGTHAVVYDPIPNNRFQNIVSSNKGTDVSKYLLRKK